MLHLEPLNKKTCDAYANRILPGLIKRIINGRMSKGHKYKLSYKAKDILLPAWKTKKPDETILKELLISEPKRLSELSRDLEGKLFALPKKSRPSKKAIEEIFHYNGVFVNDKEQGYWLAKLIGRNTCTYCNRQYVFTIEKQKGDKTEFIARPVFDHWFAKSDYPLLSLSIHNLIPSCTVCNSSVKGSTPMSLDTHVHPYLPKSEDFIFRATKKVSDKSEWTLTIDREPGSIIDKTIKDLALEEIYSYHADLEVKDLMDFNDAYTEGYINSLIDTLFDNNSQGLTKRDVYRILFGTEFDDDKFLDRPFSKLKRDILNQIGIKL